MPYYHKKIGNKNCVYKKDTGAKVGCTKGDVHKYMAALQINAHESEEKELNEVRAFVRKTLVQLNEDKKKKTNNDDEIHLPESTMKKKDLIKYLKELYNLEVKEIE